MSRFRQHDRAWAGTTRVVKLLNAHSSLNLRDDVSAEIYRILRELIVASDEESRSVRLGLIPDKERAVKIVAVDPLSALCLDWLRALVSDWVECPTRTAAPDHAAEMLATKAASFFRNRFPRLVASQGKSDLTEQSDQFIAAVFSQAEVSGAVDRVTRWASLHDVPLSKRAITLLVEQMGQHFAGVMLDVLISGHQPGADPEKAELNLLSRLEPACPAHSANAELNLLSHLEPACPTHSLHGSLRSAIQRQGVLFRWTIVADPLAPP